MDEPTTTHSAAPAAAPVDAIVVAAGRSTRMHGLDKLTAALEGRPLLAWSIRGLAAAPEVGRIVLVTAPERVTELKAAPWLPDAVVDVVAGGARRQDSVRAGFEAFDRLGAAEDGVVLVHDGARPLVSPKLVTAVVEATTSHGAAIPIVPVSETLKRLDGDRVGATVERDGLGAAQTPQGARRDLLRRALARFPADGIETWTDEAALLEAAGIPVHVVPGDPANLKVTVPDDVVRARALLRAGIPVRTGIGHDSHPFGPGQPLVLGGLTIAGAPRLHGHSDGDVVLHALADALLGAAGLGDLGRLFPADARTPAGIASGSLLALVLERLAAAGWRPTSIDLTVIGARPRLSSHLDPMREAIAARLGLDPASVNVKASTGNLDGSEGAGRAMTAMAIAMIEGFR